MSHQTVYLLHGLAAHWSFLIPLERALKKAGYQTVNWGYRSLTSRIEAHADRLLQDVEGTLRNDPDCERIHFVAHSLGAIIVRTALHQLVSSSHPADRIGRFVMLGPPNAGSTVARYLEKPLGGIFPPLNQLSDRPNSFVNQLPADLNVDVGVIAAESDFVVSATQTRLPGQRDWLSMPGLHSALLWKRETPRAVIRFLETGRFLAAIDDSGDLSEVTSARSRAAAGSSRAQAKGT